MRYTDRFAVSKTWKVIMRDMGINPAEVLHLAGLPADLFARPEATLSPEDYFKLWEGLEQAAGDGELPLMIGAAMSAEAFDPSIFATLCSPDLNTALQRLSQFKQLLGPLLLTVDIGTDKTLATLDWHGHIDYMPHSMGLSELVIFTELVRLATREDVNPVEVRVGQLPENPEPYRAYFGTSMQQDVAYRIAFSARDATRRFVTEDAAMWGFFEWGLKQRLSNLEVDANNVQRVRGVLLEMLPGGQSSVEAAARRLHMSTRSLQRRLQAEGTRFQDVLDKTRQELARHYLVNSTACVAEIALLLGFRDSNSFHRAFKTWTGTTPGAFRAGNSVADQYPSVDDSGQVEPGKAFRTRNR